MAIYKPRREASGGTSPAGTWISDSSLQDWETVNVCWNLVRAAEETHTGHARQTTLCGAIPAVRGLLPAALQWAAQSPQPRASQAPRPRPSEHPKWPGSPASSGGSHLVLPPCLVHQGPSGQEGVVT